MATERLTASRIAKLNKDGWYCDGGGLWLQVSGGGANKSWVFRYDDPVTGRRRHMGLGSLNDVEVHEARELRRKQRALLKEGKDPIAERE